MHSVCKHCSYVIYHVSLLHYICDAACTYNENSERHNSEDNSFLDKYIYIYIRIYIYIYMHGHYMAMQVFLL